MSTVKVDITFQGEDGQQMHLSGSNPRWDAAKDGMSTLPEAIKVAAQKALLPFVGEAVQLRAENERLKSQLEYLTPETRELTDEEKTVTSRALPNGQRERPSRQRNRSGASK